MRILLSGAAGFIGGHLSRELATRHDVFALVRPNGSHVDAPCHEIAHDLTEPLVSGALPDRIDAVIHLAQSEHYRSFPERAEHIFAVNVASTLALLEYARRAGAETFVFTSTGGVYGTSYERFAETDPVDPLNFYLSSKYSAELLIGNYRQFFRTVVLRPFFVYGPGQSNGMLIPRLVTRVQDGEPIEIAGEDGLRINPIYVSDAIGAFEPALQLRDSDLFNLAGEQIVSMRELVTMIGEIVGREPDIRVTAPSGDGDLVGDIDKLKATLGVVPAVSLEEGLRATIASLSRT